MAQSVEHIVHIDGGKPPRTAGGGNLVGGFLMRNKRSARWAVAPIEHADRWFESNCHHMPQRLVAEASEAFLFCAQSELHTISGSFATTLAMGGVLSSFRSKELGLFFRNENRNFTHLDAQ